MYRVDDGLCRLVPFERLGRMLVVSRDELANRSFQVSNVGEDTSIQRLPLQLPNQPSTAFSQDALVGEKCCLKRGCFPSQALIAAVL